MMRSEEVARARTALNLLRSCVPVGETVSADQILLLPELVPIDVDQAAQRLAETPKPVRCISLSSLGILTVGFWGAENRWGRAPSSWYVEQLRSAFRYKKDEGRTPTSRCDVLVRGPRGDVERLSFDEAE